MNLDELSDVDYFDDESLVYIVDVLEGEEFNSFSEAVFSAFLWFDNKDEIITKENRSRTQLVKITEYPRNNWLSRKSSYIGVGRILAPSGKGVPMWKFIDNSDRWKPWILFNINDTVEFKEN